MPNKKKQSKPKPKSPQAEGRDTEVRIIGGTFRGRRLQYHGDPVVRPMKHRTREAMFNLISPECNDRHAIDLFAGTGALGLEALSRGAASATFIEKHVPSARIVEENIRALGVEDRAQLLVTSAFLWAKRDIPSSASGWGRAAGEPPVRSGQQWLVFCSPPYAFYHERQQEMLDLIQRVNNAAPPGSILVIETDDKFDFDILRAQPAADPQPGTWDIRAYAPAVIGIWRS